MAKHGEIDVPKGDGIVSCLINKKINNSLETINDNQSKNDN